MDIRRMLFEGLRSRRTALSLDDMGLDPRQGNISLTKVAEAFARSVADKKSALLNKGLTDKVQFEALPRLITFPYSRHSSYAELCHLVRVFDPKDVYSCTVDEANWDEDVSMENLFGRECSVSKFRHDDEMRGE
jgi:DNA cross-link repair 1C protein